MSALETFAVALRRQLGRALAAELELSSVAWLRTSDPGPDVLRLVPLLDELAITEAIALALGETTAALDVPLETVVELVRSGWRGPRVHFVCTACALEGCAVDGMALAPIARDYCMGTDGEHVLATHAVSACDAACGYDSTEFPF